MATAKKAAATKKKTVAAKKAPAPTVINSTLNPAVAATNALTAEAPKRRGRPPGSGNKTKKAGKKSAGRPPATKFLYSLSRSNGAGSDDGLGLDSAPEKIEVIGPFASEQDAMNDALGQIGAQPGIEVTLYRDYRKGSVEVRTRLV